MSVRQFVQTLPQSSYGKNDKKWFPSWLSRYSTPLFEKDSKLPVTVELAVAFSRS